LSVALQPTPQPKQEKSRRPLLIKVTGMNDRELVEALRLHSFEILWVKSVGQMTILAEVQFWVALA
jgi:hypothetical protein